MSKIKFKKIGMCRLFDEKTKNPLPVTVLKLEVTNLVRIKTKEKDGYEAAILSTGKKKNKNHPQKKEEEKYQTTFNKLYETELSDFIINNEINIEKFFEHCIYKLVDAIGITKGHGFTGVMKRHNFRGLSASHGTGPCHRSGGSTGGRTEPGRTRKNQKMAGHHGHIRKTIKNLSILGIDKEKQCIFIKGSVPGPNKSFIFLSPIRPKKKKGDFLIYPKKVTEVVYENN